MKENEKKLIMNLFKKIQNTSLQTPNKDLEAEKLITFLLKNQNDSVYYMVQTLLVQDILIQELNDKVKTLQSSQNISNNSSFLSNHVKRNILHPSDTCHVNNNLSGQKIEPKTAELQYSNSNNNVSRNSQGGISSFLGTAIQTAVGVAGGMVAGNMLTKFLHNHYDKDTDLDHDNTTELNNDHSDSAVNNFFQVDSEESHEDSFDHDVLDDNHDDFDGYFN